MTTRHIELSQEPGPIGVFDSGFGGLTILSALRHRLPGYDYLYLGDNSRAPYGTRPFDEVYHYTLEAVQSLFARGCHLVILACNTASAKALRTIQQRDLAVIDPQRRVLGVIRPTAEALGGLTRSGHIGILGTPGTVASRSYDMEIAHLHPGYVVTSHACPMWVALVEYGEAASAGADYFVAKDMATLLAADPLIDTVVLGCTHYPLLMSKIRAVAPEGVRIVSQGDIVADSLADYLRRHPDMDARLTRGGSAQYLTTGDPAAFDSLAAAFVGQPVKSTQI